MLKDMKFGLHSEIGKLHSVFMHRPGDEISKITKESLQFYRFRDIPKLHKMQEEFDDFISVLKSNNIEVILLETLTNRTTEPNLLFTRDIVAFTEKGLVLMNMAIEGRQEESKILKDAFRKKIPVLAEIKKPAQLEGGDLVYIDERTLAIGYGPRSNLQGVNKLISKLKRSSIKEFVLIPLPNFRVHLDGGFMTVDHGLVVVHEPSINYQPVTIIQGNSSRTEPLLDYLRFKGYRTITVTDEEVANFGTNLLALDAGKIISYDWNTRIIRDLEKKGLEVIPIRGKELVKGGGGPHCMTSPILRED